MNNSVINSSLPFNHSSSGSSVQLSNAYLICIVSRGEYWFDFVVKVINLVVGYPANFMVVWLVARNKSESSTSDIFICSLAIADAFFCLMTPINYFGYLRLRITFFFKLQSFAYPIKDTTPLFLTCICLDRYVAVVHPTVFTSIKDKKMRVAVSMLAWGLMLAYALIKTLELDPTGDVLTGLFLVAFPIMVFCNISIMWSLRKSVLGKEKIHPMKKKALRTVQITLAITVFHYLPGVVFSNSARYFLFPEYCQVQMIVFNVMEISCSTEPLLYISKMKQLPCLNNLPCSCCHSPSAEPRHVST